MSPTRSFCTAVALFLSLALQAWPANAAAERIAFATTALPGTVIVNTGERRLYLVLPDGLALRYKVGVGREGRQWSGTSSISGKFVRPNWAPPAAILRDTPTLPALIPGGSDANPMGEAAMTLAGTNYAIHGTNKPALIGGFVSYGCIRMYNEDITDLYARVRIGTKVLVVR